MACKRCKLIRWGYLKSGTPRWRCKVCGKTRKRERKRLKYNLVRKYLIDGDTCSQLARDLNVHPDTVRRRISLVLDKTPPLTNILNIPNPCWLITDATHFKRWGCLFVTKATGVKFPIAVSFHSGETFENTLKHLDSLKTLTVSGFTTDGKRGLVGAHQQLFPTAKQQRCLVHIRMKVQTLLTQNPKLIQGKELLVLTRRLTQIKTTEEANTWLSVFSAWQEANQSVLNERTIQGKSWWYTHRNLRTAWKHILNASDNLFVFIDYPNSVSNTNHLEGLFGQRKPALVRHRGLSRTKVAKALFWTFYLQSKT
jgi:hypothetical protein